MTNREATCYRPSDTNILPCSTGDAWDMLAQYLGEAEQQGVFTDLMEKGRAVFAEQINSGNIDLGSIPIGTRCSSIGISLALHAICHYNWSHYRNPNHNGTPHPFEIDPRWQSIPILRKAAGDLYIRIGVRPLAPVPSHIQCDACNIQPPVNEVTASVRTNVVYQMAICPECLPPTVLKEKQRINHSVVEQLLRRLQKDCHDGLSERFLPLTVIQMRVLETRGYLEGSLSRALMEQKLLQCTGIFDTELHLCLDTDEATHEKAEEVATQDVIEFLEQSGLITEGHEDAIHGIVSLAIDKLISSKGETA